MVKFPIGAKMHFKGDGWDIEGVVDSNWGESLNIKITKANSCPTSWGLLPNQNLSISPRHIKYVTIINEELADWRSW